MDASDHGLLMNAVQVLARLESKLDSMSAELKKIDHRLEDHEARLREIESTDVITVATMERRDAEAATARRWLIGLLIGSSLTIIAGLATIFLK